MLFRSTQLIGGGGGRRGGGEGRRRRRRRRRSNNTAEDRVRNSSPAHLRPDMSQLAGIWFCSSLEVRGQCSWLGAAWSVLQTRNMIGFNRPPRHLPPPPPSTPRARPPLEGKTSQGPARRANEHQAFQNMLLTPRHPQVQAAHHASEPLSQTDGSMDGTSMEKTRPFEFSSMPVLNIRVYCAPTWHALLSLGGVPRESGASRSGLSWFGVSSGGC